MEETEKHMFIKISYMFALRGKQVRVEPIKKMENLGPGTLYWSWNCIMLRIFVLMITNIMLS